MASAPPVRSFGDLAWHAPVAWASDPSAAWPFPNPTLAPAGAATPGQTLTAASNGSINGLTMFTGAALVAGNRCLVTSDSGVANTAGIWIVTVVGDATHKFVLTRPRDADTPAELPVGSSTLASGFSLSGVGHAALGLFVLLASGTWDIEPQLLVLLTVLGQLTVGDGGFGAPLLVNGDGIAQAGGGWIGDYLKLDTINQDVRLARSGAKAATLDDGAGGPAALSILGNLTVPITGSTAGVTINGGGTATFGSKLCEYVKIGRLVVFRLTFTVTANGSGAVGITITATGLPAGPDNVRVLGDRATVGANVIGGRMFSNGTFGNIYLMTTPGTALTGADMANGAVYMIAGSYIAT